MRTRLLLAVALLGSIAPAHAETPTLRLSGQTSASIDLTLTETTSARLVGGSDLSATIGGRFAGFAIQALPSGEVLLGGLRVPSIEGTGNSPTDYPFTPWYPAVPMPMTDRRFQEAPTLQPGTYRFTLFADGPTTLVVPLAGLSASIDANPQLPADVSFDVFDLDPVASAYGMPVGTGTATVPVSPDTLVVVAAAAAAQAGSAAFAASCANAERCDTNGFLFGSPGSVHTRIIDDHQYEPGVLPSGGIPAGYRTAIAGAGTMRRGIWFAWRTLTNA